jgi:hypothetical protein
LDGRDPEKTNDGRLVPVLGGGLTMIIDVAP